MPAVIRLDLQSAAGTLNSFSLTEDYVMSTLLAPEIAHAAHQPLGELEDKALVEAARAGNSLAFVELCRRHSKSVIWRINRITKNWDDAEDALQEALFSAYRNLHRFENRCAFSSWLTTIGINSALMLLRRRRRVAVSLDDNYEFLDASRSVCSWQRNVDPESRYSRQEQQSLLGEAMRSLPHLLRTVIELRIDREYSVGEIADALQISESAVKSRLARARARIREVIADSKREPDPRLLPSGMFRPLQARPNGSQSSRTFDAVA
jgi:RNA polymerase sigma-70 factor, ECF subfamily